jgi:PPOX class probable F420-dependent enzyme
VDREAALQRLASARVGHLATADGSGTPHVVPFVFALNDMTVYWAVDRKPKRSKRLKRLANIEGNPNVEMVVDAYDEDWDRLWWVRASGPARVLEEGDERALALQLLADKYERYRALPPDGAVVAIEVVRVTGWSASD